MIRLVKASLEDCQTIHEMQVVSFKDLLDKYNDVKTNPGAETLEQVVKRMMQEFTTYYFITVDGRRIGVIRVVTFDGKQCRIAPMFILPQYQGCGYAQEVLNRIESLYPDSEKWMLDTIKEEPKLCHLYEKMGYQLTGKEEPIQEGMTIVYYEKPQITSTSKAEN